MPDGGLFLERTGVGWRLAGDGAGRFGLVNDYLSYLVDRNYSPRAIRTYGFGLLAFCRWLVGEDLDLAEVTTDVLLRFLAACRSERVAGRPRGCRKLGRGRWPIAIRADAESSCTESCTDSWSQDGARNPWSAPTTELWAPTGRQDPRHKWRLRASVGRMMVQPHLRPRSPMYEVTVHAVTLR